VEGYTDVLALHQAGLRNAVGIMGTALTEEQVGELERIAHVLELCLDADRAGQDAMLRASRLTKARKLELRVVGLPEGTDPADLVEREGAEALRKLVEDSKPFVAFHVDRILERADTRSAEGRDRALQEVRPVLDEVSGSILRDELVRRIAGRLELTEARLSSLLAAAGTAPGAAASAGDGAPRRRNPGPRPERTFLALCIAQPELAATMLAAADLDDLLTSEPLRRAGRHLAGHIGAPLSDLPADDEEFARLMAGLVELTGRIPDPSPDRLEHARLVLERDRLDRAIIRVRGQGVGTGELAKEREVVREAIRTIGGRLEHND
jgi:DNA primase